MKGITQLLLATATLMTLGLSAQTWSTIGSGIGQDTAFWNDVEVYNNELYVAEMKWKKNPWRGELEIKKWDGQNWSLVTTHSANYVTAFTDMVFFQGDIYVGLAYPVNGALLLKYDGAQWTEIVFPNITYGVAVRSLEVKNGELYIGGAFTFSVNGNTVYSIAKFNGTSFSSLPGTNSQYMHFHDLHFHNGDLYASTYNEIHKWDGSSLVLVATINPYWRGLMVSFNSELYYSSWNELYKIGANTVTLIDTVHCQKIRDMDVYNGDLYIVGDTTGAPFTMGTVGGSLVKYDGQNFTTITAPDGLHGGAVYNGELHYFSCSVAMYNGVQYDRAFKMVSTVGVEENGLEHSVLEVYPNPANSKFYIRNTSVERQKVMLVDATGKVIKNIDLEPKEVSEVKSENLSTGVYFINNGSTAQRIIITP